MFEIANTRETKLLKPMSLKHNFSWTFVGNVIYATSQWGILTSLAKLGTPATVGQYALGLAITAPIFMLFNLQLRAVQATDAKDTYEFGHYFGLRLVTSLIAIFLASVIAFIGHYDVQTSWIIVLIALSKGIESISDIVFGLLQKHERMDRIALSQILKGPLSLVVLAIILWLTGSLISSMIGLIVTWLSLLVFYDLANARYFARVFPQMNWGRLWRLVKLSLPLGIVMMLVSLNPNIPRYFIEGHLGADQLGYFAAITYIMVAGNTVVNALGQSASPRLAKLYADRRVDEYKRLLRRLVIVGICLGVAGIALVLLVGEHILSLLYTKEYADYNSIFAIVMTSAAIGFVSSFLGYSMTAARVFKVQPIINGIVTLSSLFFSFVLIPSKGLEGAAYTLVITSTVKLLGSLSANLFIVFRNNK